MAAVINRHVGVRRVQGRNAFRRRQQADHLEAAGARFLEPVDRGDGRVAGRQHGIEEDHDAVPEVRRHLEVVRHRRQGAGIAVESHVPDTRRRDEVEHALQQAVPGPQDGHEGQSFARQERRLHGRQRRLDAAGLGGQVAGDFIAEQQGNLAQQLSELLAAGFPLPHQRQLVPYQRMIDDRDVAHDG